MKPEIDHEAAQKWAEAFDVHIQPGVNLSSCYLDAVACLARAEKERDEAHAARDRAMNTTTGRECPELRARLDKATELLRRALHWGPSGNDDTGADIRAFLDERK